MKDQERWESDEVPKKFPMDQLRKETGQEDAEEYAAEVAVPYGAPKQAPIEVSDLPARKSDTDSEAKSLVGSSTSWLGYTAIVLGVLSLFIYPALFGASGALLGILAYFQGQRALGVWSVILGLISLAGYFLLVPLYS